MNQAVMTAFVCNSDFEQKDPSTEVEEPPGWRSQLAPFLQPIAKPAGPVSVQAASRRFYSGIRAPYSNEPTRDRFEVVKSDLVGEGVIALVDFAPGDVVFTFAGPILDRQTLFTLQIEPGLYIEDHAGDGQGAAFLRSQHDMRHPNPYLFGVQADPCERLPVHGL